MEKLIVSTSPHLGTRNTTGKIMADVLIALSPCAVAALVYYGWHALLIMAVSVATAVLSEFLFNIITRRTQTVGDLSAVVTGLILALCLPVPDQTKFTIWETVWPCIVGAVFAIIVTKCLFGGIGCNFANPAATGRVVLFVAFPAIIGSASSTLLTSMADVPNYADIVAGATPMAVIKGEVRLLPSLFDMFVGNRSGAIGESCIFAIILGFIYLVARRVISWTVPTVFVGTVALFSLIYYGATGQDLSLVLYQLMGGGLMFGAVYMATDYVTSPINKWGKLVFAFGCGIITCLIRFFGSYPEGVSFAILFMNILSPYIEKWCAPRPFGGVKNEK